MPHVHRNQALIVLLIAVGILSSCDTSNKGAPNTHSRPFVIGAFDKPGKLNPILSTFGISSNLVDIIFDGLVKIDENMIPGPGLAESWEVSENGLIWTFHLRLGVTFHDGTPLTSDDVKFTFESIGNPLYTNQFSHIIPLIKSVIVIDDYTVQITLRRPFPSFPDYLYFGILPKHIYAGQDLENTPHNYHPVGTGPYRFSRWSEEGLILKANSNYFLGKPKIHTVVVRAFDNLMASWAGLMRGDVDFAFFLEPNTIRIIENLPHLKVYSFVLPHYFILAFNHKKDIFHEKAVRQALNLAVDKRRLLKEVLGGAGQVLSGLTYPGTMFNPKEDLAYAYDPGKASKLLEQSSWVDVDDDGVLERSGQEFRFTVYVPSEGFYQEKVALFVQRQLAEVGIRAKMIAIPLSDLLEHYINHKQFDSVLWNFAAIGDPGINYLFWSSSQISGGLNFYNYQNNKVDELLERGRTALNLVNRIDAYREFQREIFRDPPGIFLFWRTVYIVLPKSIQNVRVGPGGPFVSIHQWYYGSEGETR